MEYVIATTVSTDRIYLPDGTVIDAQPGSAGFYALAGVRVFTDQVTICGGIGPEYLARHGAWYARNGVSTEGLVQRSDVTPTTVIHYFPDGSRTDEPNVGLEQFRALDRRRRRSSAAATGKRKAYMYSRRSNAIIWTR